MIVENDDSSLLKEFIVIYTTLHRLFFTQKQFE